MKHVKTHEPIETVEETVVWLTECTLATVESLRARKNPPKSELSRQINIAQVGINQIEKMGQTGLTNSLKNRVLVVIRDFGGDVCGWADTIKY